MILTAIKNYPSQISTAFKRFPLAVAFAIFTTIAFIYVFEGHGSLHYSKLTYWLSIYPIAATMIAITISLVQESRKKFSAIPHVVAGVSWFVISIALVFCRCSTDSHIDPAYVKATLKFIYTTIFLSLFIAPFFKQKDENGFWVFLMKNAKAAVIADAAGVTLKDIQTIDYSWGRLDFEVRPMEMMSADCAGGQMMRCKANSYDINIEPDDIEVSDTVTAVWEIG